MDHEFTDETITGCLECIQLKETFRKTTLALGLHHDEHDSCIKDIAYIHKEAELYEANKPLGGRSTIIGRRCMRGWRTHELGLSRRALACDVGGSSRLFKPVK